MVAVMKPVDVGRRSLDAAYQYADDVKSGKVPACKFVKQAVDRWFRDLDTGHERGLYFDENAAAKVFRFFSYCRHYQGDLAGRPIELEGWQCFSEANIFGWKMADGSRRFRMAYEEVARKNGKTTKLGGIGLYGLLGDDEAGPKVYSAATKRDQARELFDASSAMAQQSPELKRLLKVYARELICPNNFGKFEPLSADAKSMDGLNVFFGLVDELHAHPNSKVWDVIKSARGSRRQPLIRAITTAGFDRDGICYELRDYATKILDGSADDDAFFAIIYTLDEDDDFDDESAWIKANPNLGVSVSLKDMQDQCRMAKVMPSEMTEFLTKRLNIWTYGESKWMNMEAWGECRADYDSLSCWDEEKTSELDGLPCYGGLDLASVEDICSLKLVFTVDGKKRVIGRDYLPEAALEARLKKGYNFMEKFKRSGYLVVTPGNVVDYAWIFKDILAACARFDVREIAFDRWNSSQLVTDLLEAGVNMVEFGQGTGSMNAPMKDLMRLVLSGGIEHNDPLLTWAMSNLVADVNPAGDIKPAKDKVKEKIDPAVALIMALGRCLTMEEPVNINNYIDDMISA